MNIIALGDVHMSLGNIKDIPRITSADLIILTGDLTNFGNSNDAKKIIEKIQTINTNLLALAGNLDHKDVNTYLDDIGINLHGTGREINDIGIFGVGGSNQTPFKTPNEFLEEELAELLDSGYQKIQTVSTHILVSHTPPVNTVTDKISSGVHVGSRAVRSFIEEKQPALCLTGHIHESRGEDRIGKTHILNPGMIKDGWWIEIILENDTIEARLACQ